MTALALNPLTGARPAIRWRTVLDIAATAIGVAVAGVTIVVGLAL